jgi:hypothetical protein
MLKIVDEKIAVTLDLNSVTASEAGDSASPLLAREKKAAKSTYFAQSDKIIYFAEANGITSFDKASEKETIIIKNDSHWTTVGGLGEYFGNLYLLDKKTGGILKFAKGAEEYGKTNYFEKPIAELKNTASLAIDGSIYVMLGDGTIRKFTRGKQDAFQISGVPSPLSRPTRIFTNADINNLYILDSENKRIVVLGKDGAYQTQYQADVLKNALDFDVREKDKKVFVLLGGKVYEIPLK